MKYTAKFVEMVDARNNAINNMKKVIAEQSELLAYLTKEPEAAEKFKPLVEGLKNNIKDNEEKIAEFTEANNNTLFLINKLKNADGATLLFIEQVIKEIGIFENSTPPMASVENPQPERETEN